uniref:GOLD domain-containing protein n=1 Tax=Lotharella globosa TaxID=91324 RepID=A0A7S4DGL9_9EUKA
MSRQVRRFRSRNQGVGHFRFEVCCSYDIRWGGAHGREHCVFLKIYIFTYIFNDHTCDSAGDKLEITIDAENRAGTFGWYFISEGDYDIGFSVSVEEKDGTVVEARKYDKLITDKGTYTSKGPCKVTLTWDNSYSFLTSKTIKFYASVAEVNNAQ